MLVVMSLPTSAATQEGPPVYFNEDPVLLSRVRRFLKEEAAGRYGEAIGLYREVASYVSSQRSDRPYLYRAEGGLYLPVEAYLRGRVLGFPRETLGPFLEEADRQARPRWEKILRRGEVGQMREFLRDNPLSSLIPQTVEALAGYHLERGEYEEALGALRFLRGPEDWTSETRLIRSLALRGSGREEEGPDTADETALNVGGSERTFPDVLSELEPKIPPAGWRSFGGDSTHSVVPDSAFDPGRRISSVPLLDPMGPAPVRGPASGAFPGVPFFPVHDGRRVIVSDTFVASCLDFREGALIWSHSLRGDRSVPWGVRPTGHFPAASREAVFVTLSPREAARVVMEGEDDHASRTVVPGEGYRVMALEIATGEILWNASKHPDLQEDLEGAAFVSSPLLMGDRLYLLVTRLEKEASESVISLNARTGDKIWETYLGSTFSPMVLGKGIHGAYLAGGRGRIYALTNLGAIGCLDAISGGVLWVRAYHRYPAATFSDILARGTGHADEPPILSEGTLLTLPRDSLYLYALDAAAGGIRWRFEVGAEDRLVGVRGETVVLAGRSLVGIDRETGKIRWLSRPLDGEPVGRAVLAGDLIYASTTRGLMLHRVSDGGEAGRFIWSNPREEAGNIVFAGNRMITVSSGLMNVYEDRADTLRSLEALPAFAARLGEGELLLRRGSAEEAVSVLLDAMDQAGGDGQVDAAKAALARAHRALGEEAEAREDLRTAAKSYEAAIDLMALEEEIALSMDTGMLHQEMGSFADAVRLYREVLLTTAPSGRTVGMLRPGPALAAAARIRLLLQKEGREIYGPYEQEAKELLRTARKVGTIDGYRKIAGGYPNSLAAKEATLALADLYAGRNEWTLAADHLSELVRSHPGSSPETYLRVARAYGRAGQARRARKVYRYIASLEGDPPEAAEARERLQVEGGDLPDLSLPASLVWRSLSLPSDEGHRILTPVGDVPPPHAETFVVVRSDSVEGREIPTGLRKWRRHGLPPESVHRVVLWGSRLLLPDEDGIVAVDLSSGEEIWRSRRADGKPIGAPVRRMAADGNHVVATVDRDRVIVLSATDGRVVRDVPIENLDAERPPVLHGGKAVVSLYGAGLAAIDLSGDSPPLLRPAPEGSILSADPIIDPSGQVLALIANRRLVALRIEDFSVAWGVDYKVTERMHLLPGGGPLILLPHYQDRNGEVRAVDLSDGSQIWAAGGEGSVLDIPIGVGPDAIYVAYEGGIRALSIRDGSLLWNWKRPGIRVGGLFVSRGYVIGFIPRSFPPSRLVFINRQQVSEDGTASEEVPIRVPVARGTILRPGPVAALLDDTVIVAGTKGIFAYGKPDQEALRRTLAAMEEGEAGPSAMAAVRFALGRREEAVKGLAEALLREDVTVGEFERLFDQMVGYRVALADEKPEVREIPRIIRPPDIDGDLRDWYSEADRIELADPSHVSGIVGSGPGPVPWQGTEDLSGRLYMGWDNHSFYFLLDVDDTYLRPYDSEAEEWKGDCLLIAIDPMNDGGYGNRLDDVLLTLALQAPRQREEEDDESGKPKGKYFVKRKDDNSGVIYEAAIPWEMFMDRGVTIDPEKGPEPGFTFGFNPVLTDDDGDGKARKALSWTPGIRVHRLRELLFEEIVPKYYGKVTLK